MSLTTVDNGMMSNTAQFYSMKNRIINGAMVVSQRNGASSVTPNSGNTYTLDRWFLSASQNSKFTVGQNLNSVSLPAGYINYLGASVASAYSSGSSDYFSLCQNIEGLNITDLAWGTANAKTVTLSFKVYSSLTGTFSGALQNSGASRSYPFIYTVSSANTWTTISVTIAGDTAGTWLTTNGVGISVNFNLGSGSTLLGTAGAWAGTWYIGATGANNIVANAGATFYVTGVQLEVGSTATSFDYRPYGTELALCQRYYQTPPSNPYLVGFYTGSASGANTFRIVNIPLSPTMRATPSGTVSGQNTGNAWYFNNVTPTNMQAAVGIGL
ncbi:hypothetical protein EBT25_10080, partial [bacterium]|nr:hypothetical protein [bacterium]